MILCMKIVSVRKPDEIWISFVIYICRASPILQAKRKIYSIAKRDDKNKHYRKLLVNLVQVTRLN